MTDVVDLAIAEIGVSEDPPRSNKGPPLMRYGLPGEGPAPWCARFIRTMFDRVGTPLPGNHWRIPAVKEMRAALELAGAMLPADAVISRGDILFLHNREQSDPGQGNHVALVESCDGFLVNTIDGNWGDSVKRVARKLSAPNLWGFARWPSHTHGPA